MDENRMVFLLTAILDRLDRCTRRNVIVEPNGAWYRRIYSHEWSELEDLVYSALREVTPELVEGGDDEMS